MKYTQIEHIISPERLGRYLHSCNGDKHKAIELYRLNMQLSYNLYAVICYFEIALRNGILMTVFPNRPIPPIGTNYNQKYLFRRLEEVNRMRNRIAHHEPICFVSNSCQHSTEYARHNYTLLLELISWMGIDARDLLKKSEKVIAICDKIDNL